MGVYEGGGQLGKAAKLLWMRWEETKSTWDDPMAHRFEAKHLQPLEGEVRAAVAAMGQMARLLEQIRRECA
jgi:hypothetical protein